MLSPFSRAWYHADGLFIIDVWLWLVLAIAIGVSKHREQKGREWRRVPQAAIGIILVYIGLNLLITDRAKAAVHRWSMVEPPSYLRFAAPGPSGGETSCAGGRLVSRSQFDRSTEAFMPLPVVLRPT